MPVQSFEVGIVSGDRGVVDFLVDVFQLEPGARLAILMDPEGNTMEITETR